MALTIFGYPGCTTVKRARQWAETKGLAPGYHHFSKVPDLRSQLAVWIATAGIDAVFNKKSQTFKKLGPAEQAAIMESEATCIEAMVGDPRLIKRPVATDGTSVLTGFVEDEWKAAFS